MTDYAERDAAPSKDTRCVQHIDQLRGGWFSGRGRMVGTEWRYTDESGATVVWQSIGDGRYALVRAARETA